MRGGERRDETRDDVSVVERSMDWLLKESYLSLGDQRNDLLDLCWGGTHHHGELKQQHNSSSICSVANSKTCNSVPILICGPCGRGFWIDYIHEDTTTKPVSIGRRSSRLKTFAGIDSTCVSVLSGTIPANWYRLRSINTVQKSPRETRHRFLLLL